jgi:post-segregation antitoxin (ccd killing protein)
MKEKTEQGKAITLRLTQSEWAEYQRLGGIKWIRLFLRMSVGIQKEIKEENALQWKKENS